MVQTDTASSARNDVAAVRRALDAADHPALLMVDCIASMGCEPYEMDAWGVDVTLAASQKGLMTPPGLGFVWAGPRALAAHKTADMRTRYWDWTFRLQEGPQYLRFCGTAPVSHVFGFREALRDDRRGRARGAVAAPRRARRRRCAPRSTRGRRRTGCRCTSRDPAHRGDSVTTIATGSDRRRAACRRSAATGAGSRSASGCCDLAGRAFRIGHMGHVSAASMLWACSASSRRHSVAMDAPIGGSGVAAAAASIAQPLLIDQLGSGWATRSDLVALLQGDAGEHGQHARPGRAPTAADRARSNPRRAP